ncbi:MAG: hypothetical protein QF735_14040, partial [Phycisphaeraceae bacterium]|nr:hypothetical protein [Phycisphaeraceae bacterium]
MAAKSVGDPVDRPYRPTPQMFNGLIGGPIPMVYDPSFGPWIKQLRGPDGGNVVADDAGVFNTGVDDIGAPTIFGVVEILLIADGPAWTDYHMDIRTPGFVFLDLLTFGGSELPPGVTIGG